MARLATVLALVSSLALCQAVPLFTPTGKELIYDYRAHIKLGTYEPAPFASEFMLHAKLHMQKLDDKHIAMKLSDMTFKLYNGEMTHDCEEDLVPLPLPDEAHDLLKPFVMTYDEHGEILKIIMDKDDHKFSRDMKKGIGSLMQLDMEHIKMDAKEGYTFTTHENSLYGNIHVRYFVLPEHDEMMVEKMLDIENHPGQGKAYIGTTDDTRPQELWERDPLTTSSQRKYTLFKEQGEKIIKEINSLGSTYLAMMKGKSESQFMLVDQDLIWSEMTPIKTAMTKPEHELVEDLTYDLGVTEDDETLVDLSFGRSKKTMEDYEKLVYENLEKGIEHMNIHHLKMEPADLKTGLWMHRLKTYMGMLDLKTLEHMFVSMEEKTGEKDKEIFEMFQEMMPLIGTRATVLCMRNLIRKQKVDDDMATTMMFQMPFHLRMPSEKLLIELEDMIHMENVNTTVQKTATLTFATMVHKVFNHKMMMTREKPESELLEKYINKFMDLLKNAQDYSSQFLYMNALYNIRIGSVRQKLEPYVKGEATTNRHLRYLAMCTSYSEAIKDKKIVFELYWPIFADPSMPLELRAGAYFTIMGTKPSKTKLMDIYWILKNDPCPELYHMHWSFLRSMEFSTDTDYEEYKEMATEMLNFMREPMHHPLTGHYSMDFMDPNFGFGSFMSATFMSTNTSKAMYLDLFTDMYNLPVMDWAVWLKIDGMDPTIMSKTKIDMKMENNFMLEEIIRIIMSLKDQKNLHIEYAILHNDKIIMMDFADHSTLDKLQVDIMSILNMRDIDMAFEQLTQVVMPNDMGMPTVVELVMPMISRNRFEVTDDKTESSNIKEGDWKDMTASYTTFGIRMHNPIPDVWQGIERMQANEMISAINFKISMSKDFKLKLTINHQDDDSMDKFAMKLYTTNVAFIHKDLHNILQKSCKDCHNYAKVSRGEGYRHSKILFEHDCPQTGLFFEVGVFNAERHISKTTMLELIEDLRQRYFKNYQTMPFGYFLLTLKNSFHYMAISPEVGNFGLLIRATPSKTYQVNHIDVTLRASIEHHKEKDHHLPNTKLNGRFTWATKSKDDKLMHNWETNAILDMNPGHTLNNYKINFASMTPDAKQFMMCIVGMRKWLNTKMIGHMNITMGHNEGGATTCADNEGLIEIDMKGEFSDEQKKMLTQKLTYDECHTEHMHEPILEDLKVDYEEDIECTLKQTSMRKFEYDIKMTGMSDKNKEMLKDIDNFLTGMMKPFYTHDKSNIALDEDTLKLIIEYPVAGHEMDMDFITKETHHKITEVPHMMTKFIGFRPESYHYSTLAIWMHMMGMTESCMIVDQHLYNDNFELMEIKDEDWMMVVHNNPDMHSEHTLDVFVKRMKDTKAMGLRVKMDEKMLEILPEGETYKITWEGKPMTVAPGSYHDEEIFSIGMMHDKHHTVIMHMYHYGMYIDYDGEQIRMDKRKMNMHLTGLCFMN